MVIPCLAIGFYGVGVLWVGVLWVGVLWVGVDYGSSHGFEWHGGFMGGFAERFLGRVAVRVGCDAWRGCHADVFVRMI